MRAVKDFDITRSICVDELLKQMFDAGGFTAKNLASAVNILETMLKEKSCLNFLSFPADIIATGCRGVVRDLVKRKWFDILITTCGTLDHDLARAFKDYYHGSFQADDKSLHRKGINRIGNIFVPNESYGIIIEDKMIQYLEQLHKEGKNNLSSCELCWELGKRIENEESILHWCYKNKVPIVIPGLLDGGVGYQIWQFSQTHNFRIDSLKDETLLSDTVWKAEKSGGLIVGGGISKHHTIWWNQFKDGLDYAVYVSTAVEWDGSLSGARPREAVSWGKINEKAKFVSVEEDATVALPIIFAALLERI